jgi:transposase
METLSAHYAQLLGLDDSWRVETVDLRLEERRVEIRLLHVGSGVSCPECGGACGLADHAEERRWRHLDTMQFTTELVARLPRSRCPDHGVKTVVPPWAGKHSRFTLLFEAFAIEVLQACRTVNAAAALLGLSWDAVQSIMDRAVARGLERREATRMPHLGIDEKSFGKGHDYITVLTDIDGSRVVDVAPERTQVAAETVLQTEDDDRLKGTRQLWLFNKSNLSSQQRRRFDAIRHSGLKTARAWAIKEEFRWFWQHVYSTSAEEFFDQWYAWGVRCRLRPMVRVAKMLKRHLPNLLSYFLYRITNATSEGFKSVVQALKYAARGFRSFGNYRNRILFYCGRIDLRPQLQSH